MSDTGTLTAQLAALQKAEIDLLTGKLRTRVAYNGESVEYAATDLHQLRAKIAEIKKALGMIPATRPAARGFRRAGW